MTTTIPATGEFRSRVGADSAVARLLRAGFASDSIEVGHDDYGYVVKMHVQPESRMRAQKLVQAPTWLQRTGLKVALSAVALGFVVSWATRWVFTPRGR